MFRPTPPNAWQTLPGPVFLDCKRQQIILTLLLLSDMTHTVIWINIALIQLTFIIFNFSLAIKSTFIPPMTTCDKDKWIFLTVLCQHVMETFDPLVCFILTISDCESAESFPV